MEVGKKTIAAGIGLFFLGGLSVYLVMANSAPAPSTGYSQTTHNEQAIAPSTQAETTSAATEDENSPGESDTETQAPTELTHDEFLAQAEARREQLLIDKAEADRLEKMRLIKERSVECKFWRQQQKNSSASSKIEEKITQYCTLQASSSDSDVHLVSAVNL